ncbi:unnamed protein product [Lactuca virosa]|uniref:Uncharacterized protein n=1 Tax=Lactuca virosa TaxID=75947 RepID=A0AAU9MYU4_9ASTR|nr:unnamed protein product [Lactuca virosa]
MMVLLIDGSGGFRACNTVGVFNRTVILKGESLLGNPLPAIQWPGEPMLLLEHQLQIKPYPLQNQVPEHEKSRLAGDTYRVERIIAGIRGVIHDTYHLRAYFSRVLLLGFVMDMVLSATDAPEAAIQPRLTTTNLG